MKQTPILFLLLGCILILKYNLSAQSPQVPTAVEKAVREFSRYKPSEVPKVMVIGTFHFAEYQGDNSGNTFTANPPDVMSGQRQQELKALRELLATFQPTKICVEWKHYNQDKLTDLYNSTSDLDKLSRNEIHQIGIKLGKELGHPAIYAVDTDNRWFMDSVAAFAFANNQAGLLMKAQQIMPGWLADSYKSMESMTMTEVFLAMNSPEYLRFSHAFHLELATIGTNQNYIGTELYSDWMKRNTKIFSNINWITEPNDRILILYGASHAYSLKEMFGTSYNYELVELNSLLK